MSTTTIFVLTVVVAAGIAASGIVSVAFRRRDTDGAVTQGELELRAARAEKARRRAIEKAAVQGVNLTEAPLTDGGGALTATLVKAPVEYKDDDNLIEVTENEYGVTRRKFLNRAIGAVFGLFMLQLTLASLAFMWPKLKGGFGTPIKAGSFDELKAAVLQGGTVVPKFVPAAQSWVVPFELSEIEGSSFEATPYVVAGGESDGVGLMALWQRCVHLGCRVPSCESSQGFECPCHGSKYNKHGEYEDGPAPRNLDRFAVSIDAAGQLVVDTGTIVQTARSINKTAQYPQGPFCVG